MNYGFLRNIFLSKSNFLFPHKQHHPHHRQHRQGRAEVEGSGGVDGLPEPAGNQAGRNQGNAYNPVVHAESCGRFLRIYIRHQQLCDNYAATPMGPKSVLSMLEKYENYPLGRHICDFTFSNSSSVRVYLLNGKKLSRTMAAGKRQKMMRTPVLTVSG